MIKKCKKCGSKNLMMVEYGYTGDPEKDKYMYDGVSELRCMDCKARFGRWTDKELKGEEREPRYGEQLK